MVEFLIALVVMVAVVVPLMVWAVRADQRRKRQVADPLGIGKEEVA